MIKVNFCLDDYFSAGNCFTAKRSESTAEFDMQNRGLSTTTVRLMKGKI